MPPMTRYHSASRLIEHGLDLPVPASVFVAKDVSLDRIARRGVVLWPGTRIEGGATVIDEDVVIGELGAVVLRDVALGRGTRIASGAAERCVLLDGASLGPDAHVRAGTLLEEGASTGHAVGLKQTVLMAFSTLGSLINFCDCLLTGGRSRRDHSEVGSGFIHFNFTPHGAAGDKATPSLFGTVPRGVTLREDRVFLGGSGGVVGPVEIGFGTCLAAGATYRQDHGAGELVVGERLEARTLPFASGLVRRPKARVERSVRYVAELRALQVWYRRVRLARAGAGTLARLVLERAVAELERGVAERVKQICRLLDGAEAGLVAERARGDAAAAAIDRAARELDEARSYWTTMEARVTSSSSSSSSGMNDSDSWAAIDVTTRLDEDHVAWVRGLSATEVASIVEALSRVVAVTVGAA